MIQSSSYNHPTHRMLSANASHLLIWFSIQTIASFQILQLHSNALATEPWGAYISIMCLFRKRLVSDTSYRLSNSIEFKSCRPLNPGFVFFLTPNKTNAHYSIRICSLVECIHSKAGEDAYVKCRRSPLTSTYLYVLGMALWTCGIGFYNCPGSFCKVLFYSRLVDVQCQMQLLKLWMRMRGRTSEEGDFFSMYHV